MITLFVGCSYTFGEGFDQQNQEPNLWVNLLHSNVKILRSTELVNLGESASSNEKIFYKASRYIAAYRPRFAFVQWTSAPRYNILLGIETYHTNQYFGFDGSVYDHKLHSVDYSKAYLENIKNRFLSLHHPHQNILNIVGYTNSLIELSRLTKTQLFFINGLCSWDRDYFTKLNNSAPSEYTVYTQKILETDTRDDEQVSMLYDRIHCDYAQAGTVQEPLWLNLYDSFLNHRIDTNNDNLHPGINSNQFYFELVRNSLINKLSS